MVKPITPGEVEAALQTIIPYHVLEAFNEMIISNFSSQRSVFARENVVSLILKKMTEAKILSPFPTSWLDVGEHYRRAGWTVCYDKDKTMFTFSAPKAQS